MNGALLVAASIVAAIRLRGQEITRSRGLEYSANPKVGNSSSYQLGTSQADDFSFISTDGSTFTVQPLRFNL